MPASEEPNPAMIPFTVFPPNPSHTTKGKDNTNAPSHEPDEKNKDKEAADQKNGDASDYSISKQKSDLHRNSLETVAYKSEHANFSMKVDDEDDVEATNCCARSFERIDSKLKRCMARNRRSIFKGIKLVMVILYFAYFGYCMYYRFGDEGSITLLAITVLAVLKLTWPKLSPFIPKLSPETISSFHSKKALRVRKVIRYFLYVAVTVAFGLYFALSILKENPKNVQSLCGIACFVAISIVFSTAPAKIDWHPVFWSFAIQICFAILTLRTETGYQVFKWLGDNVQAFIAYSDAGSAFVLGENFKTMGLAFSISGILIFFNAVISLLIHVGAVEFIVLKIGMFLHYCLGTGPVESVIAAANIFIGLAEAPLLVRPYLATVTRSELHSIMVCGFASIAGGIMAIFIEAGAPANHLLTAAIISAPSALALTKILVPETENVNYENQKNIRMRDNNTDKSLLKTFSEGALQAVPIIVAIMANMVAFLSILNFIDVLLDWLGRRAGVNGLTFEYICSFILYPLAYVMGVPTDDCRLVGSLIGVKLFATPMVGYVRLGEYIENRRLFEEYTAVSNASWHWSGDDVILEATNTTLIKGFMSVRAEVISTYAMCGFSAFTAIGITLGSLIPMCPSRKDDIISLVLLAFLGGNLASFATGSVAGMMYTGA